MTVQPYEIRQRLATSLLSALGSDWRESPIYSLSLANNGAQGKNLVVIEVPKTSILDPRQNRSGGTYVTTDLSLRLLQVISGNAQVASYDAAIATEATAISAIYAMNLSGLSQPKIASISRQFVPGSQYLQTEILLSVPHVW